MNIGREALESQETREREFWGRTKSPLVLFDTDDIVGAFDLRHLSSVLENGDPIRKMVDGHIAKVLPFGSEVRVRWIPKKKVFRVLECEYSPYSGEKRLFGVAGESEVQRGEMLSIPARRKPSPDAVLEKLISLAGVPYLYGGSSETPSDSFYNALQRFRLLKGAARNMFPREFKQLTTAYGLDCSGLLNVATNYWFFGDSKDVWSFARKNSGKLLKIEEKGAGTIGKMLKPLDIIVFKGHMIVSLGDGDVIQAAGVGENADAFAKTARFSGKSKEEYNRVVIDSVEPILQAVISELRKTPSNVWRYEDPKRFMIVRF